MLENHAYQVLFVCLVSETIHVYGSCVYWFSLYPFSRFHFTEVIIISITISVCLSHSTAASKATNLPSPYSVFSFFPKYISNSYKYLNFDTHRDQNLETKWTGFFFNVLVHLAFIIELAHVLIS